MKRRITPGRIYLITICLPLIFLNFGGFTSRAQTTQEIINKHIKAIGGQTKVDAIHSYSFQIDSRYVYYKKPGKWRIDHKNGNKIVQTQIYHGEKGWTIFNSGEAETAYTGMDFESFLLGLLVYAKTPDFKVSYSGKDTESDNFLIKVSSTVNNLSGYNFFTYYINPTTYLVTKMAKNLSGTSYVVYFEDYSTINGLQVPIKISMVNDDSKQKITFIKNNIKVNEPLDDTLFRKPVLKKQLVAYKGSTGKYGFRDENSLTIINPTYDDGWGFNESGLAKVKLNNLFGFINKNGKVVIPIKYTNAQDFYEGLCGVQTNKKWGYINEKDKLVIPMIYDNVRKFKDGLATISSSNKWGCIDNQGKVIIPVEYDYMGFFQEGKVSVKKDGAQFFIDKTGKRIN